jgi:hypothetical protein
MKLPNKIFNRACKLAFETTIYTSSNGGVYKLLGGRTSRTDAVCILYTIPNRNSLKNPNIKGFQRSEMDLLWKILKQKKILTTNDFRINCPELYKEGPCCFSAFCGIINVLFPNTFIKTSKKISFLKTN